MFAGKVCVPIDPQHCEDFDPNNVPTLAQVSPPLSPIPPSQCPCIGLSLSPRQLLNHMNATEAGAQEGSGKLLL